jgi:predicted transposase YdaD
MLFVRRWQRQEIEELLQFLDWIMSLPEALEVRFDTQWQELEREQTMAQTMPPIIRRAQARGEAIGEQRGIEIGEQRGIEIGKRETLLRLIQSRFGPLPADLRARIEQVSDIDRLDRLTDAVLSATTLEEMPIRD